MKTIPGGIGLMVVASVALTASSFPIWDSFNTTIYLANDGGLAKRALPTLRVLTLGASITYGTGSDDKGGNGYRMYLRDQLRYNGHQVNMIGSRQHGSMKDNDNEGWEGFNIRQVHEKVKSQYRMKPNVVLINAGTNDCRDGIDPGTQPDRMKDLVRDILDNVQDVTIILSGLVPHKDDRVDACAKDMDDRYFDMALREFRDRKVLPMRLHTGYLTRDDILPLPDGTHPTDLGYQKLASLWATGIERAVSSGWIKDPLDNGMGDGPGSAVCDKIYGSGNSEGPVQTQVGSGTDDGNYRHNRDVMGRLMDFAQADFTDHNPNVFFAQLLNEYYSLPGEPIRDSFIWHKDPVGAPGIYEIHVVPRFGGDDDKPFQHPEVRRIDVKNGCKSRGVRWGDVNGDGRDDFICIGPEGDMWVSINDGPTGEDILTPTFHDVGKFMTHPEGRSQEHVRLGDIDGDGRLDYCVIFDNGDIQCWRNGGTLDTPEYWQDLGIIFTGKGKGDIRGVRFVDINGDRRSDWLYVNDDGSVDTWINNRGYDKGSLKPDWRDAGRTHGGMSTPGARDFIKFGRVGTSGRADYMWLRVYDTGESRYTYIDWWRNTGSGGTQLKGDGVFYCDMTGDFKDDYVWVSPTGTMQLYRNILSPPNWGQDGIITTVFWERKNIRLADIDGDGKCDIVYIDQAGGENRGSWRRNQIGEGKSDNFGNRESLEAISRCGRLLNGVGQYDTSIRLADINGDKKADILCVERNGRTLGHVSQRDGSYKDMGQVKKPEGADRANVRFVDVNGDGKADYLWVDKFTGDTQVWYNEGETPASGSSMTWRPAGNAYQGSSRGPNLHFPNLRGIGRADMYEVHPRDNTAKVWYSPPCPGSTGGDDGPIVDPVLPIPRDKMEFPKWPRFVALGDSYSAGIGAGSRFPGDKYDPEDSCYRTNNAYSAWLKNHDDVLTSRQFDFISCSGDRTEHILRTEHRGRKTQLNFLREVNPNEYAWGLLSIGGNDIGFGKIAKACLLPFTDDPKSCQDTINEANSMTVGTGPEAEEFKRNLISVYTGILDMETTKRFTLIVTGYARFFNSETQHCNSESLSLSPGDGGPRLTNDLRRRLNEASINLNNKLKSVIEEVNARYTDKFIRFYDIDPQFDRHRFCDVDDAGNERENDWQSASWFFYVAGRDALEDGTVGPSDDNGPGSVDLRTFNTNGCPSWDNDEDPRWWICRLAETVQGTPNAAFPPGSDPTADFIMIPEWANKAFHPKSIVHKMTAEGIKRKWITEWGAYGMP